MLIACWQRLPPVSRVYQCRTCTPEHLCRIVAHYICVLGPAPRHKLGEAFYVRQDGTRAYYFSTEELTALFVDAGYTADACGYVSKQTSNRKMSICVPRVYAQGKFRKP